MNPDHSLEDPELSKFGSPEISLGEQYHTIDSFRSSVRHGQLTFDGVHDSSSRLQPYSCRTGSTSRRSFKSYQNVGTGRSDENLLNVTCSLDTDSFFFSSTRARFETDVDSSLDYGALIEGNYAASVTSPGSCYSSASLESRSERPHLVDKNSGVIFQTVSQVRIYCCGT
jgi:hypothetical protein